MCAMFSNFYFTIVVCISLFHSFAVLSCYVVKDVENDTLRDVLEH